MIGRETSSADRPERGATLREPEAFSFGPFRLNDKTRLLEKDGVAVKLGSRALDLLRLLVGRAGEIVSKTELLAHAWPGLAVEEISLRVHIAELRKALGDGKAGARYITNIPSRGYCFVAPVQRVAPELAPAAVRPTTTEKAPPVSLPNRLDRMVGREDVLQELSARLQRERFITVRGPGGIGKTTVAVALAHEMWTLFDGQVIFLDLAPLRDASLVPSMVASALGLVVHHDDPTSSIVSFLRERRMLIVLDSCEHVIEVAAGLAERVHQGAAGIAILATSREPLMVEGEWVFELVPLAGPPPAAGLSASEVLSYPAARLFVERAAAAGHRLGITDDDADALIDICNKLDGIALAIELAAGRVGAHGLREIATLLDGRLKLEWRGRRTAPQRQQTLGATLDWSYGLISEAERAALRRFAIFAGPFTLQAAVAVAGDEGEQPDHVVEALEQLVTKSLVTARPEGSSTRYRLLDTTKAYALQKLAGSSEANRIARRHALYVQRGLETTMAEGGGDQATGTRAELLADARAALTWVYWNDDGAELRVPLAGACARLFVELNLLNEGRVWANRALTMLDDTSRGSTWELELQSALGHAFMFTERNSERAEQALRRGLDIAAAQDDRFNRFRLLARLNMFYRRTGEYRHLLAIAHEAEKVAREIGDAAGIAGAKALVGVSYHLVGNQAEAQRHLDEGVQGDPALRRAQPGHFAYSRTPQIPLARVLWLRGFPDQAVECVRPLTGATAPRDVVMHCIALCWSASLYGWVGDWAAVESMTDRLANHAGSHGLTPYEAVAGGFRAQTLIARGELKPGIELLRSVLPRLHADRYELYASAFVAELSQGLAASGQLPDGLKVLHEAIARIEPHGDAFDMPELLRLRGELEASSGDVKAAEASFAASVALAEQQGALSWRLRTEMSRVRLQRARRVAKPASGLAETYARFSEGFETADLKAARRLLDAS